MDDQIFKLHEMIRDISTSLVELRSETRQELLTSLAAINLNLKDLVRQVTIQNGRIVETKEDIAELQREFAGLEEWRGSHVDWTNQALHRQEVDLAKKLVGAEALLTKAQVRRGYIILLALFGIGASLTAAVDQITRHWNHIIGWR